MNLDVASIASATGGDVLRAGGEGPIGTDTRNFPVGGWFVALVGPRFDGHAFVGPELERIASGVIVERPPPAGWTRGVVVVPDTTRAIADLGRFARSNIQVPVVGITGSSGKTTTRAFVALALSPMGLVHQTVGNLNNHLGVPMTLLAAPRDANALVVEMGTSGPGEIARLADIGRPTHRLIVNVGPAHLEELGSLEGVAWEKGAMFRSTAPGDFVFVNRDDPFVSAMQVPSHANVVGYGRSSTAEVRLVDWSVDGTRFATRARVQIAGRLISCQVPALGEHFALNATSALAVAWALGVDLDQACGALEGYQPVGMRQRTQRLGSGGYVINDAYNANPASVRASLGALAALPGRRIAALGDMLELGPTEIELHRDVLEYAVGLGLERIVVVGPRMAEASRGLPGIEAYPDPHVAGQALGPLSDGDYLLVKGSRGVAMEQLLQSLSGEASSCSTT